MYCTLAADNLIEEIHSGHILVRDLGERSGSPSGLMCLDTMPWYRASVDGFKCPCVASHLSAHGPPVIEPRAGSHIAPVIFDVSICA